MYASIFFPGWAVCILAQRNGFAALPILPKAEKPVAV
jgi:hypothetical protein